MSPDDEVGESPIDDERVGASLLRYRRKAMATVFEISLIEDDEPSALQAADAAFDQVDQLEQELSYFIPESDVSRINRLGAGQSLRIGVAAFECIGLAKRISVQSGGAFDPTAGGLLEGRRPWDEQQEFGHGEMPEPKAGPVHVGMELIELNEKLQAVAVLTDGVSIDLGGIGKGYALDHAAVILRDWGMERAVLCAGKSTILPIDGPPEGWPMRVLDPANERDLLGRFRLAGAAVSTSSVTDEPHILDPGSGEPAQRWLSTFSIAPTAAEADALSTAFMLMDRPSVEQYCRNYPAVCAILVEGSGGRPILNCCGDWHRFDFQPA